MKIIKKYTALMLRQETVNEDLNACFQFGSITGPYYDRITPETEFDTEEEAIAYAYKQSQWDKWLIVPIIKFDNP